MNVSFKKKWSRNTILRFLHFQVIQDRQTRVCDQFKVARTYHLVHRTLDVQETLVTCANVTDPWLTSQFDFQMHKRNTKLCFFLNNEFVSKNKYSNCCLLRFLKFHRRKWRQHPVTYTISLEVLYYPLGLKWMNAFQWGPHYSVSTQQRTSFNNHTFLKYNILIYLILNNFMFLIFKLSCSFYDEDGML